MNETKTTSARTEALRTLLHGARERGVRDIEAQIGRRLDETARGRVDAARGFGGGGGPCARARGGGSCGTSKRRSDGAWTRPPGGGLTRRWTWETGRRWTSRTTWISRCLKSATRPTRTSPKPFVSC